MLRNYTFTGGYVTDSNIIIEERRLFGTIEWMKNYLYRSVNGRFFEKNGRETAPL